MNTSTIIYQFYNLSIEDRIKFLNNAQDVLFKQGIIKEFNLIELKPNENKI